MRSTVQYASLGSVVEITGGGTPSKARPDFYTGNIPWVTPKDMKTWNIVDALDHITEEAINSSATKLIPTGAVLLVIRSGVLKHSLPVAINRVPVAINQDMKALRCDKRLDPDFLARFIKSQANKLLFTVRGTTADNISTDVIRSMQIPLPPLAEQKRIAAILDKADEIRRKREKAIELTDSFLRSVFLEMFGDPVTNPKGWGQAAFSSLLLRPLRNGVSPSSKGTYKANVLTLAAITGKAFCSEAVKEGLFENEPRAEKIVDPSDFLICRGNGNLDLVGRGKFCSAQDETVVFPDTMIAACIDQSKILPSYLNLLWNSRCIRGQLERSARTTNGTYKVNQSAIEAILVLLPPFKMQKRFAEVCQAANDYRKRIESASHLSAALASSLTSTFLAGGYTLENGEGPLFVETEAHALQL